MEIFWKRSNRVPLPHSLKYTRVCILQGEDSLTTYAFNTKQAKHLFCKVCGVQSFYQPRCTPGGYGETPVLLLTSVVIELHLWNIIVI